MAQRILAICPYAHLAQSLACGEITHVVSILGGSDQTAWPDVGRREWLRLAFDDVYYSSGVLIAPSTHHISRLISFGRRWQVASGSLLVHCRAGTSRSPAAMILAALVGPDDLLLRIATAKSYFRPHAAMLATADRLLGTSLGDLVRALPAPSRTDDVGPVAIPLAIA